MTEAMQEIEAVPFAGRLRAWRRRLGLTQSRAAAELGIGLDTLRAWEHAARRPVREANVLMVMEIVERRIEAERPRG